MQYLHNSGKFSCVGDYQNFSPRLKLRELETVFKKKGHIVCPSTFLLQSGFMRENGPAGHPHNVSEFFLAMHDSLGGKLKTCTYRKNAFPARFNIIDTTEDHLRDTSNY